jgi:hypothetical protein
MSCSIFSGESLASRLDIRKWPFKELRKQFNRYWLRCDDDDGFDRCVKRGWVVFVHG